MILQSDEAQAVIEACRHLLDIDSGRTGRGADVGKLGMGAKPFGGDRRLLNDRLIADAAVLIGRAYDTRGREGAAIADINRQSVRRKLGLQCLLCFLIFALGFGAAYLDLGDYVVGARPFGKIRFVQITAFHVDEPAAGIAGVAIRELDQLRTVRHGRLVEFEYMGAGGNTIETVLTLTIGDNVSSILHV